MDPIARKERHFPRIRFTTPIRVQVRGGTQFNRTVGENVSESGLCFVNDRFIAPLTPVMLEIEVLSRVLRPIGRIIWSTPNPRSNRYRLGTEFIEFDAGERKFLSEYVNMTKNNSEE
jgi:hypothetical protein